VPTDPRALVDFAPHTKETASVPRPLQLTSADTVPAAVGKLDVAVGNDESSLPVTAELDCSVGTTGAGDVVGGGVVVGVVVVAGGVVVVVGVVVVEVEVEVVVLEVVDVVVGWGLSLARVVAPARSGRRSCPWLTEVFGAPPATLFEFSELMTIPISRAAIAMQKAHTARARRDERGCSAVVVAPAATVLTSSSPGS